MWKTSKNYLFEGIHCTKFCYAYTDVEKWINVICRVRTHDIQRDSSLMSNEIVIHASRLRLLFMHLAACRRILFIHKKKQVCEQLLAAIYIWNTNIFLFPIDTLT